VKGEIMRKVLVESYIDRLLTSFGPVKILVGEEKLYDMYNAKNYAGMVCCVQEILRLNMRIRLGLVNKGGPKDAPAWIIRPQNIPIYGSQGFRQTTVTIYLRKPFLNEGTFEALVCAIAHEFCHVVLDAVLHPLKEKEEAVDLTAMLLGFRDFYVTGCQSVNKKKRSWMDVLAGKNRYTIRYLGYLTPEEVDYVASYMTFR
jgi:hypothetical protein